MRIDDHRARAVGHDRAGKLSRCQHRTLHVKMRIEQARRQVSTLQVDDVLRFVLAQADHSPVIDGNVRSINLAAENIDEVGVFEEGFRWPFTTRDAEFLLKVAHKWLGQAGRVYPERASWR